MWTQQQRVLGELVGLALAESADDPDATPTEKAEVLITIALRLLDRGGEGEHLAQAVRDAYAIVGRYRAKERELSLAAG